MKTEKFEDNNSKIVFLLLLIVTVCLITYFRVNIQLIVGPEFDGFDFLSNAALFAGKSIGYSDILRPPFLPFLTSLYFRFDGLYYGASSIIDGLIYIFGCIGLYLFLKERFNAVISCVGSLLFATFPIIITFAGAGLTDVSSVCITIWAVYLTYLGVRKNSKFFYLVLPVFLMAFLTRFNMALVIFPILAYIIGNRKEIKNPRNILLAFILGIMILVPLFIFFSAKFGNVLYVFLDFLRTSSGSGSTMHFAYNPDSLYFVKNMPYYIGTASWIIILLSIFAFFVHSYKKVKPGFLEKIKSLKKGIELKLILTIVLLAVFILTFGKTHYMVSEIIFFAITILIYETVSNLEVDLGWDLLFFSWFMAFFIFQSVYIAKDHRYFIAMAPPVAYFLTRGLNFFTQEFEFNYKNKNLTLYIFSAFLVLLMLSQVAIQLSEIEHVNQKNKVFNQDVSDASGWLKVNDPEYKSKVIYADYWPYFGWYLQTNVGKMPMFRDNQSLYQGVKDYNFTADDKNALNNELNRIRPDYYMCAWEGMNFTNYQVVARFGSVTIFKRVQ
ncbi:MAG: glycosyltransferase family 39 protein [Methanobacteriaceae archaeon]|nr:glycosyltransferase family 39 protein [Methanobacteriaceae archaeon]